MRTFKLFRKVDDSGVSGTGVVAEGAVFHDGQVCLAWFSTVHAMAIYPSIEDVIKIHGHQGHTVVVWDDENGWDSMHCDICGLTHAASTYNEPGPEGKKGWLECKLVQERRNAAYEAAATELYGPPKKVKVEKLPDYGEQ